MNNMTPWDTIKNGCGAAGSVLIVAPYIKAGALRLVIDALSPDASVECVTRWTPLDIRMGTSDTECREITISRGGSFRLHNSLHAKYYRFDEYVLVGSANLTASGLSYPHKGNLEILCEPAPSFDRNAFERELRAASREVSDEEFHTWNELPVDLQLLTDQMPMMADNQTREMGLDNWMPQTRNPEYLWQFYTDRLSEIVIEEQRELAQSDLWTLQVPAELSHEAFTAWVRTVLMSSPFVDTVRQTEGFKEQDAWDFLADRWQISLSTAARSLETANNWLRHFER